MACGVSAVLFLTVLLQSRPQPVKAQTITSVCMDEAYAYFNTVRPGEAAGPDGDTLDDILDSVGEELNYCLDDMLPFPDPYQWRALPRSRTQFEFPYTDSLFI